ncbi:hypothetical protein ECZU34_11290 [Escherichia coli]|nr:hypothetical protein ECZU34_11290 [Escherichia coli]
MTTSILNAGFPDSSSYYRKADETLGMTAKQFRHGGENLAVRYALADCELGRCRWQKASGDLRDIAGR